MQEFSTGTSRARRLADSLIVVLAIFLALHQYSPTRALVLVALRRNRSCMLAKMMDGDREVRRLVLVRADNRRRSNLKSRMRRESDLLQAPSALRHGSRRDVGC